MLESIAFQPEKRFENNFIHPTIGEDIDLTWRFEKAEYKLKSVRNHFVQTTTQIGLIKARTSYQCITSKQ